MSRQRSLYKPCSRCHKILHIDNFYLKKNGYWEAACFDCSRTYLNRWRAARRVANEPIPAPMLALELINIDFDIPAPKPANDASQPIIGLQNPPKGWKPPQHTTSLMFNAHSRYEAKELSRSDKYQYVKQECLMGVPRSYDEDEDWFSYQNKKSDYAFLINPFLYNEKIIDAKERLVACIDEIAEDALTDKQLKAYKLVREGRTQEEACSILGIGQSALQKALAGNKQHNKMYGGVQRKLPYLCSIDEECQKLLNIINDVEENDF